MTVDEHALIHRCQSAQGEAFQTAFSALYEQYKDRVYNVAYRITGNPADALDASQETFAILYRKVRDFRFQSKFSSWVYRITVNASIDLCRRSPLRNVSSLDAFYDESGGMDRAPAVPDEAPGARPRASAEKSEFAGDVNAAIQKLSPKLRSIVALRYLENLSYEEVAEVLGCSLGTVKSRLARAHAALEPLLVRVCEKHLRP